jgi:hypothetical protein
VTAGEKAHEHAFDDRLVADDRLSDLGLQGRDRRTKLLDLGAHRARVNFRHVFLLFLSA